MNAKVVSVCQSIRTSNATFVEAPKKSKLANIHVITHYSHQGFQLFHPCNRPVVDTKMMNRDV